MTVQPKKHRHHSAEFKFQLCHDIRTGVMSKSQTMKAYALSAASLWAWLGQYDSGELRGVEDKFDVIDNEQSKIAALERKVGQLTMEIELLKKTPRLRLVNSSENSLIISGPKAAPSGRGVK